MRCVCLMMADRKMKAAKAAFDTSLDNGITFFDTAEVYGSRVRKKKNSLVFLPSHLVSGNISNVFVIYSCRPHSVL